ncbi:LPS export ABC transporter periplasmic protein LptC [Marinobacter sp.]|uniref:LPS export ABC transporter periplasmic protein LptC n=1 Tax=Marinobacter sp. TaxID=50741 RepID=UPI00198A37D2|nr:LPS export ABC transporter periplasmic protein LptC [Marinobacter sp.]MBC7193589.1 LPS export ABC transporter periplasmic protein LptC [Marinobacter sp.]
MTSPATFLARPRIRNTLLALLVSALLMLMWQSDQPEPAGPGTSRDGSQEPDGFVEQGRYLSFNEQGRKVIEVTSPRIEQFEQRQLAIMESPEAWLNHNGEDPPWHLVADHGKLEQDGMILTLTDHVVISTTDGRGRQATLSTSRLQLDNKQRTATTDQPVTIRDPAGVTRATGMKAWVDDRILELQSDVEGIYEPARY